MRRGRRLHIPCTGCSWRFWLARFARVMRLRWVDGSGIEWWKFKDIYILGGCDAIDSVVGAGSSDTDNYFDWIV
jgi:hypothetical protein